MSDPTHEQPARYAPDWYETAIWLATTTEGAHHDEVRLYRAADGRYFRFELAPAQPGEILGEYPHGEAEQLTIEQARAFFAHAAERLVTDDEAFPDQDAASW